MKSSMGLFLENENIVIYGAGSVGKRFYQLLKEKKLAYKVVGFAETDCNEHVNELGVYVKKISLYKRNYPIAIAAHYVLLTEMEENLKVLGFSNYKWIYPELFDIAYGNPIKKNIDISVIALVKNSKNMYTNILYLLAIEAIEKENSVGLELYRKYMQSFCSEQTTMLRIEYLKKRISEYKQNVIDDNYAIKLNNNKSIILDGAHRVMLSYYYGIPLLKADLYNATYKDYINFSRTVVLDTNTIETIFTGDEIELINDKCAEIKKI